MDELIKWAYSQAIISGTTDGWDSIPQKDKKIISAETISRVWAIKSLRTINPRFDIIQADLTDSFDCKVWSGGTWQKIEHKYRDYLSTDFKDYQLSGSKYGYCRDNGVFVLFTFKDGCFYLYDLAKAKPEWRKVRKRRYKVVESEEGTYTDAFLKPEDAILNGKIKI